MSVRNKLHPFDGPTSYLKASINKSVATAPLIAYLAPIGGAVSAVLILGLYLQWSALLLIVFACTAGALAGALVFTLLDVFRLQRHRND